MINTPDGTGSPFRAFRATSNSQDHPFGVRVCQLLLGHSKLESTVRYLGVDIDDAISLSESIEI